MFYEPKLDIDMRTFIEQDIQSARDPNVRKALNELKHQVEINCFDEIIALGSHSMSHTYTSPKLIFQWQLTEQIQL